MFFKIQTNSSLPFSSCSRVQAFFAYARTVLNLAHYEVRPFVLCPLPLPVFPFSRTHSPNACSTGRLPGRRPHGHHFPPDGEEARPRARSVCGGARCAHLTHVHMLLGTSRVLNLKMRLTSKTTLPATLPDVQRGHSDVHPARDCARESAVPSAIASPSPSPRSSPSASAPRLVPVQRQHEPDDPVPQVPQHGRFDRVVQLQCWRWSLPPTGLLGVHRDVYQPVGTGAAGRRPATSSWTAAFASPGSRRRSSTASSGARTSARGG